MSWIKTIPYGDATGKLKTLYDRIKGPDNNVDNVMMLHSLRPHTMEGHMALYKHVLHNSANSLPKWFAETIGVWVSQLNQCEYCVEHHFAGLKRLLRDDEKAAAIRAAVGAEDVAGMPLTDQQKTALDYATLLTRAPGNVRRDVLESLRAAGYSDGEILEINQVVAYFCYANRTVLGLGCCLAGDILGLSPNASDEADNWSHT